MASTLTLKNEILRVALSATPLEVTQINFAAGVRSVELQFTDSAGTAGVIGYFSLIDTDGAAITTARSWIVLPGSSKTIPLRDSGSVEAISKIYVASSVASGICYIHSSEIT